MGNERQPERLTEQERELVRLYRRMRAETRPKAIRLLTLHPQPVVATSEATASERPPATDGTS